MRWGNSRKWHIIYAWKPIKLDSRDGVTVWLERIEAKEYLGYFWYREIGSKWEVGCPST